MANFKEIYFSKFGRQKSPWHASCYRGIQRLSLSLCGPGIGTTPRGEINRAVSSDCCPRVQPRTRQRELAREPVFVALLGIRLSTLALSGNHDCRVPPLHGRVLDADPEVRRNEP